MGRHGILYPFARSARRTVATGEIERTGLMVFALKRTELPEFLGIEPHHQLSHSRLPIGGIFVADHFTVSMQPRNPAPIGCRQDQFEFARDRKSTRLNSSH